MCVSLLPAGMMCHDVLPRVWRLAFGEWHIPRDVDDGEDFHKLVRSKVHRAKLWHSGEHSCWRSAVISTCSVPAEHLLQEFLSPRGCRVWAWFPEGIPLSSPKSGVANSC